LKSRQQVRAQCLRDTAPLDAHRFRVGQAQAAQTNHRFSGLDSEGGRDLLIRALYDETKNLRTRPCATCRHLLGEGQHLLETFLQLIRGDKCSFAALAVQHTQVRQRLQGLANRHTADPELGRNDLLRGNSLAGLQPFRPDLIEKELPDLVIQWDDAISVEHWL